MSNGVTKKKQQPQPEVTLDQVIASMDSLIADSVFDNTDYAVSVFSHFQPQDGRGFYAVVNKETKVIELMVAELPKAMGYAIEASKALDEAKASAKVVSFTI